LALREVECMARQMNRRDRTGKLPVSAVQAHRLDSTRREQTGLAPPATNQKVGSSPPRRISGRASYLPACPACPEAAEAARRERSEGADRGLPRRLDRGGHATYFLRFFPRFHPRRVSHPIGPKPFLFAPRALRPPRHAALAKHCFLHVLRWLRPIPLCRAASKCVGHGVRKGRGRFLAHFSPCRACPSRIAC